VSLPSIYGRGAEPAAARLNAATAVALIPAPVEVLGDRAELDDQVVRKILRLDLAAFLAPEPNQGRFIVAHNDPGIRAADDVAAIALRFCKHLRIHGLLQG
jgi:hypothetical protein